VLLLLNLALFGWVKGLFGTSSGHGHEAGRLDQQIAAERIRVLTDPEIQQLRRRAAESKPAPAPVAPAAPPLDSSISCVEIGDFSSDGQLVRLRERLAELKLADRASEHIQVAPGWYLVYLPPAKSLADAQRRAEELRAQEVRDVLVVQGEGAMRFSILLGSFRDRDLALKQQAQLEKRGVKGARVTENPSGAGQVTRVRVRGLDAAAVQQLEALQKEFAQQKVQACGPEATP
jgi:cell division protein FtsN